MNASRANRLTVVEAASVVAGLGVGGGIMAVPYLASRNGLLSIGAILVLAYGVSLLFNLMVAEVATRERGRQLVEVLVRYVFAGRIGRLLLWPFFVAIAGTFVLVLAGFLVGCAQVLSDLANLPLAAGVVATYAAAAGVVWFGLRAVGVLEKAAVGAMAAIFAVLAVCSLGVADVPLPPVLAGGWKETLALYGMVMFSFTCFWSVPQAAEGLGYDRRLVPRAVALGIGINLVFVLVVTLATMKVAPAIGDVAIVDWSRRIGPWALAAGGAAIFLAMITSYWANAYALAVICQERLAWSYRTAWLAATVPSLALALAALARLGFLEYMRLAGGVMAVLLTILIVPAYRRSRRAGIDAGGFDLGSWGGAAFQAIVVVAYVAMAVGSVVPVD